MPVAPHYKAPPAAVFSWTGCYVGGNAGWIGDIDRKRYDLAMAGGYIDPANGFGRDPDARARLSHSYSPNGSGFTGGVQAGCNYQMASFVWGVEADFNGSSLRETINANFGPSATRLGLASSHTESVTNDLNWFSTFRGRAGFAWDRLLIYGTGGAAVARFKSSSNILFGTDQIFLSGTNLIGSDAETRFGWVAGAGVEWAFMSNWSFKAEFLHLDFGSFSYQSPCVDAACVASFTGAGLPLGAWSTSVRARENIVRFGVNYRFGGPVVANY
jgi:outer membrane immunogenic protein